MVTVAYAGNQCLYQKSITKKEKAAAAAAAAALQNEEQGQCIIAGRIEID